MGRPCKCNDCKACRARGKMERMTGAERVRHRGFFKGKRPKGRKARLDELEQARKEFFWCLDWYETAKGRHAEHAKKPDPRCSPWPDLEWAKRWLDRARKHYLGVLAACERDQLV